MPADRYIWFFLAVVFQCSETSLAANAAGAALNEVPPEARHFDFWIGEWTVTSADGSVEGSSRVEAIAGGRGLLEHWTGSQARGHGTGKSLSAWNAEKKQWQQFWIGSTGVVLELRGGLDGPGRMVLRGEEVVDGQRRLERITWSMQPDETVRQRWEQSTDDGQTWRLVFDGRYTRKVALGSAGGNPSRALMYLFL